FRDELGLHPDRRAVQLGLLGERAGVGRELLAARFHVRERALVEPRADVPAVAQLALVPIAEEKRPERSARSLALRDPADDELRAAGRLDLEPSLRPLSGFVFAVLALGDDAFEAARERRLVEFFPVFLRMHQLDMGRREEALLEPAPAVRVGRSARI